MRSALALTLGILIGGAAVRWHRAPPVLRVSGLEVVNARGDVVGRFTPTDDGAELVVGGRAQVSVVTDGDVAAVNLVGTGAVSRWLSRDRTWFIGASDPPNEPD